MTKEDLQQLRQLFDERFKEERGYTQKLIRGEIGSVRGEVKAIREEMASVRGEVKTIHEEIGSVRGEIQSAIHPIKKELHALKNYTRKIRKDVTTMLTVLNRDDMRLVKRVHRIEEHLHLPPLEN